MKYSYLYNSDEQQCLIVESNHLGDEFDELKQDDGLLLIDVKGKNIEHLSKYFKNAVISSILSNDYKIELDDSDIQKEEFYSSTEFQNLKQLIDSSIKECNSALLEIKNSSLENSKDNDNGMDN